VTTDPTHVERVLARALDAPDAEILRDQRQTLTAGAFAALVFQLARALEQRGLGRGDRVAILADQSCEAMALRYAAGVLGCASVFCPNRGPEAFAGFLELIDPAVLVVFPETAGAAGRARCPVVSLGPADGVQDDLLAAAATLPAQPFPVRARPDDLGYLVPSGGTTGAQKASRLTFATYQRLVDAGPQPGRRQLVCLPLAYVSQIHAEQTLLGGGSVVLAAGPDPATVLETIEAQRITHLGVVEPILVELLDHPDVERRDLSSLRALAHIGANAPASLRRRLLGRVGPVLVHPYGASEIGVVSVLAPPDYSLAHPDRLSSSGRPLPGIEVRVERPDGSPAEPGELGQIVVRSPTEAGGYVRAPAVSGYTADGFRTGDLGVLDADGYLHVRGRAADARAIDGQAVLPLDVEDALCAHPGVRYAVALPDIAPDGRFAAAVVLGPDADVDPADLARDVDDRATIAVVDRIPATDQGKPDRAALRERLATPV
jgi:acyl-CoA synthetase (AMP-forming)/AMP-acid ligase II